MEDGRCKLGLAGRLELVRLIESGATFRQAAPAWALRRRRPIDGGSGGRPPANRSARRVRACGLVRRSRGRARGGSVSRRATDLDARERTNLGPARLAGVVGTAVQRFEGLAPSRLLTAAPDPEGTVHPRLRVVRTRRAAAHGCQALPVFTEPGHWRTETAPASNATHRVPRRHCVRARRDRRPQPPGLRRDPPPRPRRDRGWRPASSRSVDDRARLRHHPSGHDRQRDDLPPQPQLHGAITELGAATSSPGLHPRWNGKAERFIRTMLGGWAYGQVYRDSDERNAALAGWLDFYNRRRPHGALSHKPPIARLTELNNLLGPTPDMESRLERRDKPAWR